jgi:hypothetical protein
MGLGGRSQILIEATPAAGQHYQSGVVTRAARSISSRSDRRCCAPVVTATQLSPGRQGPAQPADSSAAVGHQVKQVRREHHVNGAITDRQRGHIGIDSAGRATPAQHAGRQVTPHGAHPRFPSALR